MLIPWFCLQSLNPKKKNIVDLKIGVNFNIVVRMIIYLNIKIDSFFINPMLAFTYICNTYAIVMLLECLVDELF